ncbi:MAG TPA: hypothetical protein VD998_03660 [Verrucomicrobiae bacterium]|nr:hypothetical protein [Verrucomicrobiae bacterium]
MDIVKKIKPLKASYDNFSLKRKFLIIITLISLVSIIVPHQTELQAAKQESPLLFVVGDYEDLFEDLEAVGKKQLTHEQTVQQLKKQLRLAERVRQYLITQNSPLAEHANVLVQQNNWKKIVALSNAESTLCRKYIEATNNCWGVGGSDLWTMGTNLGEGVVSMNRFLNNHPLRSPKKYSEMSFDEMNGLYKQPARDHWVYNNLAVYDDLVHIENSL